MKKFTKIIFMCAILFVLTSGLLASVAQAEPFWCDYYCWMYGNGCEVWRTCTCPMNQQLSTNCALWCGGFCNPV